MKNQLQFFLLAGFICFAQVSIAQSRQVDSKSLKQQEDSMKQYVLSIVRGRSAGERVTADSIFTRMFVKALKTPNSFYYPFDSLITISKQVPPDSSFRIFTWQLNVNDYTTRQHGAIQMRTSDGSLKLFPLVDRAPLMKSPEDTVGSNLNWIGAVYYKIIQTQAFDKTYYTLLGFDDHDINSNRKIIEILTFENGRPVFGGNNFSFPNSSLQSRKGMARYIMTYKKNAGPRLNFDPEMNIIIMEHLISETGQPEKKYTYVGDGDYEGLKWKDGKWVYINKVFTEVTPEGKAPVPQPLLDEKGKVDPSKLKQNQQ